MEKLIELQKMADDTIAVGFHSLQVTACDILAIADAFRALEQRAEAAEAIATDVEEVIGLLAEREWAEHCTKTDMGKRLEDAITELHDDAAHDVSLVELVPDERDLVAERQNGFHERAIGWNECRAAILSKIEEIEDEKT